MTSARGHLPKKKIPPSGLWGDGNPPKNELFCAEKTNFEMANENELWTPGKADFLSCIRALVVGYTLSTPPPPPP